MFGTGFPDDWSALKRLIWLRLMLGGGEQGSWETLSGSSPLALVNSLAHAIKSLTQYGKCVQDGTPTPSSPVDIVCNNGEIKYGALGANLFDTNPACIKLNFYIQASDGTQQPSTTNFIYVPRIPVEPGKSYVFYGRKKSGNTMSQYNRIAFFEADGTYISTATYPKGAIGRGAAPENAAYCILSCNPSGESAATGTPISQEIIDSYNWTFAEGTAEIIPFEPFVGGIYTDGTPEVLTVSGINLLDPSAVTTKKYINASGQELPSQSPTGWLNHSDYISVTAGEDYTLSVTGADGGTNTIAFNWFDANKTILATRPTKNVTSGTTAYTFTNTAPADAAYLIVNFIVGTNVMVEESATPTAYEPYVTPQTVTNTPMLLSVGDDKDALELISGHADIAITVFRVSPDLNWALASGTGYKQFYAPYTRVPLKSSVSCMSNIAPYGCTASNRASYQHGCYTGGTGNLCFQMIGEADINTVDDWKTFLRVNGVYVVAVKAAATTEQTTPHALHTVNGTTIVDAATAVDPVELDVEYMKGA